jgi:hypothetical protein
MENMLKNYPKNFVLFSKVVIFAAVSVPYM